MCAYINVYVCIYRYKQETKEIREKGTINGGKRAYTHDKRGNLTSTAQLTNRRRGFHLTTVTRKRLNNHLAN